MNEYLLCTSRCGIRELAVTDLDAEFKLYGSPHITDYIPPLSEYEKEAELCQKYAEEIYACYGYGMWGIFDLTTGRLIGEAGLEPRFDVDRSKYPYDWMFGEHSAELGFVIAEDLWGQGYCKEVCRAIIDHCREHFGITEIFARTRPENVASVRVLTRLGFKECGAGGNGEAANDAAGTMKIYRLSV